MQNQAEFASNNVKTIKLPGSNDEVLLKAKGVLLEVYDKLTCLDLSPRRTKECQKSLSLFDDKIWDCPPPNTKTKFEVKSLPLTIQLPIFSKTDPNKRLLKKYFSRWKNHARYLRQKKILEQKQKHETTKLDNLVEKIKKSSSAPVSSKTKKEITVKVGKDSTVFKNRFKAQKSIIQKQKQQLEEQNKLIQELKLGIIRDELYKSIDNTKVDIQEIFKSCTNKMKANMPHLQGSDEREKIMINSQKAPKILMKMERRAKEREIKREIILERKRLLDIQKQKITEELIERKKIAEEEERKRNLEIIEEKRKRDMEMFLKRKLNKEVYTEKLGRAMKFCERKLMKKAFEKLSDFYRNSQRNNYLAVSYFESKTKKRVFDKWNGFIEEKYKFKYDLADSVYEFTLLKRVVSQWRNFCVEIKLNMQTASDYFDFKLTSKVLVQWRKYTYWQNLLTEKKLKLADEHYKRKILFQYYYQWKSLPAVIQLEKAKEMKKLKWRSKVWEILPDYQPPDN